MDLIFGRLLLTTTPRSMRHPIASYQRLSGEADDGPSSPSVPLKAVIASIMMTNQVNVLETAIGTLMPSPRAEAVMKPYETPQY